MEGKIEGERDRGGPRTTFVKQIISDARILSFAHLKRLAKNRKEWRALHLTVKPIIKSNTRRVMIFIVPKCFSFFFFTEIFCP